MFVDLLQGTVWRGMLLVSDHHGSVHVKYV